VPKEQSPSATNDAVKKNTFTILTINFEKHRFTVEDTAGLPLALSWDTLTQVAYPDTAGSIEDLAPKDRVQVVYEEQSPRSKAYRIIILSKEPPNKPEK